MSGDLLGFIIGPTPYSWWWLALAAVLLLLLIGWYVLVFALTLPGWKIGNLPILGPVRNELLKRRCARAVQAVAVRYRSGELAAAPAAAAVSRQLRGFLSRVTGARIEYMQTSAIATSELASAAAVLTDLSDAQFNADSTLDVGAVSDSAEELIRTWN